MLHRGGKLNPSGNEVLDTISVSNFAHEPFPYVDIFLDEQERWYPEQSVRE